MIENTVSRKAKRLVEEKMTKFAKRIKANKGGYDPDELVSLLNVSEVHLLAKPTAVKRMWESIYLAIVEKEFEEK